MAEGIAIGSKLYYEVGSSWTAIPDCTSITVPSISVNSVDYTNLDNTDYWKTFGAGTIDGGSITFEALLNSTVYNTLSGFLRDTKGWKVTAGPDFTTTVIADGFITKLEVGLSGEDKVVMKGEIKITGIVDIS